METIEILKKVDFFCSSLIPSLKDDIEKSLKFPVYKEVKIPKPDGKIRTLHIPEPKLKKIQKIILQNILYELPVSPSAHCAIKRRSIVTNIQPHLNAKAFFKIDFKDAFPSVNRQMVVEYLTPLLGQYYRHLSDPELKDLAYLISSLTTYRDALPQGAPTSPYILNLVCYKLDQFLLEIASKFSLNYTRYADDLWFSSQDSIIPKEARRAIIKTVQDYGFKVNRDKISYKTGKATVPKITGITLVQKTEGLKPSIPRRKMEEYRNKIHLAISDPKIDPNEIFGIMGWVTMAIGNVPRRLKKPFSDFLLRRCPEKIPRYAYLFK